MSKFIVTCSLLAILLEILLIAFGKSSRNRLLVNAKPVLVAEYDSTYRFIAAAGGGILFCLPLLMLGILKESNPVTDRAVMAGYYLMVLYFTLAIFNTRVILTDTAILVSGFLGRARLISGSGFRGARESRVTIGMHGYRFSAGKDHVVIDEKMENALTIVGELRSRARAD